MSLRLIIVLALLAVSAALGGAHAEGASKQFKAGSAEAQALAYLKSLRREWSGSGDHDCHTYESKNLERLQPAFIVASAAFLKAFVATHGPVTITSAHRNDNEQVCVCYGERGPCAGKPVTIQTKNGPVTVRPVGLSRHQLGIAMDVRPGAGTEAEFVCLHEFARANPQFGVQFPLGRYDLPHMEMQGARGPAIRVASIVPSVAAAAKLTPCQRLRLMLTLDPLD